MTVSRADASRPTRRVPGEGSRGQPTRDRWWAPSGRRKARRWTSARVVLGALLVMLPLGAALAYVWTRAPRDLRPRPVTSGPGGADTPEPCNIDHASARRDPTERCVIDTCHQSFADCDGNPTNGCEIDLRLDPDHCGRCDARCASLEHAERGCGGRCTIWRCARGFRDCNDQPSDGCEVDVTSDPRHCGHCGRGCGARKRCEHGRCV